MLNQQTAEAEEAKTSSRAADVRVSNDELVAAMAAIEARRNDPHFCDTIALGDAVQQLGLDMTPEQLLAEIQAKRQQAPPVVRKRPHTRRLLGAVLALSLAVNLVLVVRLARMQPLAAPAAAATIVYDGSDMDAVLSALNANSFDKGKVATVRALAKTRPFTSDQVRQILQAFSFDQGREDAAVALYPAVTDQQNFLSAVLPTFSFDSGRQNLIKRLDLQ